MNDLPLFSTPPEVAELLRVKPERVRKWIERGELIGANLGDGSRPRYRIARADLQAFLDKKKKKTERGKSTPKRKKKAETLLCRY